jgi:hypothetical protein
LLCRFQSPFFQSSCFQSPFFQSFFT